MRGARASIPATTGVGVSAAAAAADPSANIAPAQPYDGLIALGTEGPIEPLFHKSPAFGPEFAARGGHAFVRSQQPWSAAAGRHTTNGHTA
jgi:hypothetical protein